MNTSSDAAEQVMRMTLEGTEVLIKLSGSGAMKAAALLHSVLRQHNKTRGQTRLTNMLKSGKPLCVYSFDKANLEQFKNCAREYGILYTVLKDKQDQDHNFDVLVPTADEYKMKRIIQRFKLTSVNIADIQTSMKKEKEEKAAQKEQTQSGEEPKEEESEASAEDNEGYKEEASREVPAEEAADEFSIALGEKPVTENPTLARQDSEKPYPETTMSDEGRAPRKTDSSRSKAQQADKSSNLSSWTAKEKENAPSDASTSQPKSGEYKTPEGKVDISDVIQKKKEARAVKAGTERTTKEPVLPKTKGKDAVK